MAGIKLMTGDIVFIPHDVRICNDGKPFPKLSSLPDQITFLKFWAASSFPNKPNI